MIRTGSLSGTGTISANGGVGVTPLNDGGGGGGAGGSVVVTTNTGTVNGLTIHANGGNGTNAEFGVIVENSNSAVTSTRADPWITTARVVAVAVE